MRSLSRLSYKMRSLHMVNGFEVRAIIINLWYVFGDRRILPSANLEYG
ncbi:hypothetical protein [Nostoc piscinale]